MTYPTIIKIQMRWGEMDAFGHLNNVLYMRYFETARVQYFEKMPAFNNFADAVKPVLVSINGEFKQSVVYPDTLTVSVGVKKMGNASMTMACEMYSEKGFLAFVGECVIVMVDLEKQRPQRITEELRNYVLQIEGQHLLDK
jgi:acyl-CoA thioester hydrolase